MTDDDDRQETTVPPVGCLPAARTYCAADMRHAEIHDFAGGAAVIFSSRCPSKDTPNEDAAALISIGPQAGVLLVADGVGGSRGGEEASKLVVDAISESLRRNPTDPVVENSIASRMSILNGIETANQTLLDVGQGSATTLAVVEIQGATARPYHVGDSMIIVVGQRGKIKLQTVSHSPVGFAVEAGILDAAEAMHHEERHVVSNYVGSSEMRIEIGSPLRLSPRDTLLVASDGLFDNLHLPEIVECIRSGPLDNAIDRLAADCRQRMLNPDMDHPSKTDDTTIVAFRQRSSC